MKDSSASLSFSSHLCSFTLGVGNLFVLFVCFVCFNCNQRVEGEKKKVFPELIKSREFLF